MCQERCKALLVFFFADEVILGCSIFVGKRDRNSVFLRTIDASRHLVLQVQEGAAKDSWFQHIAQEVPVTSHTDLYDGGDNDYIPFDKLVEFFQKNLK